MGRPCVAFSGPASAGLHPGRLWGPSDPWPLTPGGQWTRRPWPSYIPLLRYTVTTWFLFTFRVAKFDFRKKEMFSEGIITECVFVSSPLPPTHTHISTLYSQEDLHINWHFTSKISALFSNMQNSTSTCFEDLEGLFSPPCHSCHVWLTHQQGRMRSEP